MIPSHFRRISSRNWAAVPLLRDVSRSARLSFSEVRVPSGNAVVRASEEAKGRRGVGRSASTRRGRVAGKTRDRGAVVFNGKKG